MSKLKDKHFKWFSLHSQSKLRFQLLMSLQVSSSSPHREILTLKLNKKLGVIYSYRVKSYTEDPQPHSTQTFLIKLLP